MKSIRKFQQGFIALTLVITIASLLLAFSFMQSIEIGHFFGLAQLKEYRLMNYYNAYSCIDQAILNLAHDYFYEISTSTEISYLHCAIDMVKKENDLRLIAVHGNYKKINVKRSATVRLYDNKLEIISID